MRAKTIVLVALCVTAALTASAPAVAQDAEQDVEGPCVKISTDPPGVAVDPDCLPPISAEKLVKV